MTGAETPDPWQNDSVPTGPDGEAFADLIAEFREVQVLVGSTRLPPELTHAVTERLSELRTLLEPWVVPEQQSTAGKRHDLPGRGHPLLLPFVTDEQTETAIRGRVSFSRFYVGGNGAAHGGTLPLVFDEVMGRICNANDRPRARTAYLHVNYRAITPIGPELEIEATIDSDEGRKRRISGRLYDGDRLLADADGLFVVLLAGQP